MANIFGVYFVSQSLSLNQIFLPLSYRMHPRGLEGPLLHRPVWAGAPEASCGQPPAVCRSVLQGRQPHPEEWRCQAPAGPRCRHSGAGSAWTLHHRPGEAGHREGPSEKASANGKRDLLSIPFIPTSGLLKRLWLGYTIMIAHRKCNFLFKSFFFVK